MQREPRAAIDGVETRKPPTPPMKHRGAVRRRQEDADDARRKHRDATVLRGNNGPASERTNDAVSRDSPRKADRIKAAKPIEKRNGAGNRASFSVSFTRLSISACVPTPLSPVPHDGDTRASAPGLSRCSFCRSNHRRSLLTRPVSFLARRCSTGHSLPFC